MSGLTLLRPGSVFAGDYRIVRPLREGGMGAVYVAEQISTSEQRALKIMQPSLVENVEARRRFEREAKIGSLIKSDFIVKVIQAGIEPASGMPWLAMELLEGEELEQLITRNGPLPVADAYEVLDQLCDALGKAHQAGIVHRDLKPENVFMALPRRRRERFIVKVLDFGIARLLAEAKTTSSATHGVVGTPLFMAPEQANPGAPVGPATDIWPLGLIAFRVLTGKHFWRSAYAPSPTLMMLAMEAFMQPIPLASERAREWGCEHLLPPGFDSWFARCMSPRMENRFADATAAFAGLESVLGARPSQGSFAPAPSGPIASSPGSGAPIGMFHTEPAAPAAPFSGLTERAAPAWAPPSASSPVAQTSHAVSQTAQPSSATAGRGNAARILVPIAAVAAVAAIVAVVVLQKNRTPDDPAVAPVAPTAAGTTSEVAAATAQLTTSTSESQQATSSATHTELPPETPKLPAPAQQPQTGKGDDAAPPKTSGGASIGGESGAATTSTQPSREFDKGAAVAALNASTSAAKVCGAGDGGPKGVARVRVTFGPNGKVTSAAVDPPFAGTPTGACIAGAFRGAHVPPFDGSPVSVSKSVTIN